MYYTKLVPVFLFMCIAFSSCKNETMPVENETEFYTVAGFTYGKFNNEWYFVIDGKKGDRANLDHLTIKPKVGIDMNNYNFQAAGVPTFSIITVLAGEYYILDTSGQCKQFDVAKKLWSTGDFDYIQFVPLYEVVP